MNDQGNDIGSPIFKVASAWVAIGVTSWADFASLLAAFYTLLLISEWFWKKILKPALIKYGYLPVPARRADDHAEAADDTE